MNGYLFMFRGLLPVFFVFVRVMSPDGSSDHAPAHEGMLHGVFPPAGKSRVGLVKQKQVDKKEDQVSVFFAGRFPVLPGIPV
jgi:hypothetical protein